MEHKWPDKTILVAEDVEANFMLIQSAFRHTDAKLLWAQNGLEALSICKTEPHIHLILMDIRMPVMDGFEAIGHIRKFLPQVPIIAQTSYAMDGDRDKSLAAGCNDYISKPFNLKDLLQIIAQYLEK